MIPNYELLIRRDGDGYHLSFTHGERRKEVTIESLDMIEKFLQENCEGYNDKRTEDILR